KIRDTRRNGRGGRGPEASWAWPDFVTPVKKRLRELHGSDQIVNYIENFPRMMEDKYSATEAAYPGLKANWRTCLVVPTECCLSRTRSFFVNESFNLLVRRFQI